MLNIIRRFGKHFSCHLQDECIVGIILEALYTGHAVRGGLDLTVMTGEAGCYVTGKKHVVEENR
jgi:hypothetical protein